MTNKYSVLMSVYYKEKPKFLKEAVDSILNQTVKTDNFVIVCDGPLTDELNKIIDNYADEYPHIFNIVRLPENLGLARALNAGIEECKNDIIARMDSDDISVANRIEKQFNVMKKNNVHIVGGSIREFQGDISHLGSLRTLPEKQEDIIKFAKTRSPFNHPTVMYQKTAVKSVGKYENYPYFEDYNLWVLLLNAGFKGYNISDVILYMRAGEDMYKRRGGWAYVRHMVRFKKHLKDINFISTKQFLVGICGHGAVGLMPNACRKFLYTKILRKTGESETDE